jgi:hypothetical protein
MNSTPGNPANETQVNPTGRQDPNTVTEQTCANCGMKQDEWRTPQGYHQDGETFCCEGCATGAGCTC